MDIDKLILANVTLQAYQGFGSLMDIDKLILRMEGKAGKDVLVL